MADKPKITRLGDPNNPYTKKKVTAEQAAASRAAQPKAIPAPAPARKKPSAGQVARGAYDSLVGKGKSVLKNANAEYNERQRQRIDKAVDG